MWSVAFTQSRLHSSLLVSSSISSLYLHHVTIRYVTSRISFSSYPILSSLSHCIYLLSSLPLNITTHIFIDYFLFTSLHTHPFFLYSTVNTSHHYLSFIFTLILIQSHSKLFEVSPCNSHSTLHLLFFIWSSLLHFLSSSHPPFDIITLSVAHFSWKFFDKF